MIFGTRIAAHAPQRQDERSHEFVFSLWVASKLRVANEFLIQWSAMSWHAHGSAAITNYERHMRAQLRILSIINSERCTTPSVHAFAAIQTNKQEHNNRAANAHVAASIHCLPSRQTSVPLFSEQTKGNGMAGPTTSSSLSQLSGNLQSLALVT